MTVDQSILNRILPTAEDKARIIGVAEKIKGLVCEEISRRNLDVEVRLMGSVAKGTYLCNPDLDIFMLFRPDVPRAVLEKEGLEIGIKILQGEKMYADHPYIRGEYSGLEVDLVPCYAICDTDCLQSAVDRTPFHTAFILENMDECTRDEARVMKAFMKGVGTYGAEPQTRGFSGYLIEIMVLHYGDFQSTLHAAAEWTEGTIIGDGVPDASMMGPLIFFDPVDARRNVASAVHMDTFATFIVAARAYLKNPCPDFFFPKKREQFSLDHIKDILQQRGTKALIVSLERPKINSENLEAQMWKTEEGLRKALGHLGFNVLRSAHISQEELQFAFELEEDILPPVKLHVGPPVWVENAHNFLKKWNIKGASGTFIQDGRWNVLVTREKRDAASLLFEESARISHGQNINIRSMMIMGHEASLINSRRGVLSALLDTRFNWEL